MYIYHSTRNLQTYVVFTNLPIPTLRITNWKSLSSMSCINKFMIFCLSYLLCITHNHLPGNEFLIFAQHDYCYQRFEVLIFKKKKVWSLNFLTTLSYFSLIVLISRDILRHNFKIRSYWKEAAYLPSSVARTTFLLNALHSKLSTTSSALENTCFTCLIHSHNSLSGAALARRPTTQIRWNSQCVWL